MEKRGVDVLKVILDKGELRHSKIVAEIKDPKNNYSWGLDADDSLKVTVCNILKQLEKDYLKRIPRGHMDVRYRFKSKSAKERARKLVFSQSSEELKKAICDIVEVHPGDIAILLELPLMMTLALGTRFSLEGKMGPERTENLRFYKNRVLEIMGTLYEIFLDLTRGSSIKDLEFEDGDEYLFDGIIPVNKGRLDLLEELMSMEGLVNMIKQKAESIRAHKMDKASTAL
jgi:hypothetical protein